MCCPASWRPQLVCSARGGENEELVGRMVVNVYCAGCDGMYALLTMLVPADAGPLRRPVDRRTTQCWFSDQC